MCFVCALRKGVLSLLITTTTVEHSPLVSTKHTHCPTVNWRSSSNGWALKDLFYMWNSPVLCTLLISPVITGSFLPLAVISCLSVRSHLAPVCSVLLWDLGYTGDLSRRHANTPDPDYHDVVFICQQTRRPTVPHASPEARKWNKVSTNYFKRKFQFSWERHQRSCWSLKCLLIDLWKWPRVCRALKCITAGNLPVAKAQTMYIPLCRYKPQHTLSVRRRFYLSSLPFTGGWNTSNAVNRAEPVRQGTPKPWTWNGLDDIWVTCVFVCVCFFCALCMRWSVVPCGCFLNTHTERHTKICFPEEHLFVIIPAALGAWLGDPLTRRHVRAQRWDCSLLWTKSWVWTHCM